MIGASFSLPALALRQRPSGRSLSFAGGVVPARLALTRASGATHYATPATLATVGVDIARLETGVAGTYLLVEPRGGQSGAVCASDRGNVECSVANRRDQPECARVGLFLGHYCCVGRGGLASRAPTVVDHIRGELQGVGLCAIG